MLKNLIWSTLFGTCLLVQLITNVAALQQQKASQAEEDSIIWQFYTYCDGIRNIKMDNVLTYVRNFANDVSETIVEDENDSELQDFIQRASNAMLGAAPEEKFDVIDSIPAFLNSIEQNIEKREIEDLRRHLQSEAEKLNKKMVRGAEVLRHKFTEDGHNRHWELFDNLTNLQRAVENNNEDEASRLMIELDNIRKRQYASRRT